MKAILSRNLYWTLHAKNKMRYYGLSESRIKRVLKQPKRAEEGMAENTAALMQPTSIKRKQGQETWNQEIWVMIQIAPNGPTVPERSSRAKRDVSQEIKIISAWRYPGRAPARNPIPPEIIRELEKEGLL